MKCICGGKTKVNKTVVSEQNVKRYRICTICGKKMITKEVDVAITQNEHFIINKIKDLISEIKK